MDIGKLIFNSGFCPDSPAFFRFYLRLFSLPALRRLLPLLRVKFSPDLLENIRAARLPVREKGELFAGAMNFFRSGPTYRTTGEARTPLADAAIRARLRPGMLVVEAGVSDGLSAAGLLANPGGAEVMLTDRQAVFRYRDLGPLRLFYDRDEGCLSFKLLFFYVCTGVRPGRVPEGAPAIATLNPAVSEAFGAAAIQVFDVFSGRLARPADVIKCANLLNTVYFSPAEIRRALENLAVNLREGGLLYLCHSNAGYADGEAYIALRRAGGTLRIEEERNSHELSPVLRSGLFRGLTA